MPAAPTPDERPDDRANAAAEGIEPPKPEASTDPTVHIPDDASELEADRLRYLDEKARGIGDHGGPDWSIRGPVPSLPAFLRTARFERFGFSGPLVIVVLVAVGIVGSFMTTMRPQVTQTPTPLPLAASNSAIPGTVGGLLPAGPVTLDGVPLGLTRLRPAVLVVVPRDCVGCDEVVQTVTDQAREFRLRTVLVGAPDQNDQLVSLSRDATSGIAVVVADQNGALTGLYPGPAPTVVLVHADGVIADIVEDPGPSTRLEGVIAILSEPARP